MARQREALVTVDGNIERELATLDSMPATIEQAGVLAMANGYAIQQTRSSHCTAIAVQKPRTLHEVQRRLLEEARLAGEEFYYGWSTGKDKIEGPSIKLATAAARCWGNCAVEMLPVQETPDAWVFTAVFVDLETGFNLSRQFRQSKKWVIHGKLDENRKEDIRFQIGQSKATRNVILNAIPASLIEGALREARAGVRGKIAKYIEEKGHPAACDLLLKALARLGVDEARVLARCGVAEAKGLSVDHLVLLKGDLHAIQNGQERAEELFPVVQADATLDRVRAALADAQAQAGQTSNPAKPVTAKTQAAIRKLVAELGMTDEGFGKFCETHGADPQKLTEAQGQAILKDLTEARDERAAIEEPATGAT